MAVTELINIRLECCELYFTFVSNKLKEWLTPLSEYNPALIYFWKTAQKNALPGGPGKTLGDEGLGVVWAVTDMLQQQSHRQPERWESGSNVSSFAWK